MSTLVSVNFDGSVSTAVNEATVALECSCAGPQPSASFSPALQAESRWADAETSARRVSIVSPSAYLTLAMPPVGTGYQFRGRLLYFRSLEADLTWTLELTQRTSGVAEFTTGGMLIIELPEADELTLFRVQGSGAFEWLVTGRVEAV